MRGRWVSDLVLSLQVARLAVALQPASLVQQVVKGGHRAGLRIEGPAPSVFPPSADVSVLTLPTSGGAKGRAAQRSQGLLGIVEPLRRVAALPRSALIGRRCGRRSMRFGAASGPTLGPTTETSLRVTIHHQCRRADGWRASAATKARGPASWWDLRRSPMTASAGRRGAQGHKEPARARRSSTQVASQRFAPGLRPAQPLRSLPRETRSGSPLRPSVSSLARPGQHSFEWRACRCRRSCRRSGRIGTLRRR
jgi:hypothetical protein